jgi:hypothetical protein
VGIELRRMWGLGLVFLKFLGGAEPDWRELIFLHRFSKRWGPHCGRFMSRTSYAFPFVPGWFVMMRG